MLLDGGDWSLFLGINGSDFICTMDLRTWGGIVNFLLVERLI